MSGILATLNREVRAYFLSPLGWVVAAAFLFLNGIGFSIIVGYLTNPQAPPGATPLDFFFGDTIFFWFAILFVGPMITMRLIAEERRSGTMEPLMTAPVTETQVVLGKFFGALAFYVFLWAPTLAYAFVVGQHLDLSWGPVASGYLGILGIGCVFLAAGLFASSLTESQIVAAVLAFAFVFALFVPTFLGMLVFDPGLKAVVEYLDLYAHMGDFSRGVVDSRRLVYYLSATGFFLFLTTRGLALRQWR